MDKTGRRKNAPRTWILTGQSKMMNPTLDSESMRLWIPKMISFFPHTLTPSSQKNSIHLPMVFISNMHAKDRIQTVYADKGYAGTPNRGFLALNDIKDGIMRKDSKTAKLTEIEIERNKAISKFRYIVEQYFGISHKNNNGQRARFPKIMKNTIDIMFRQFAFYVRKGAKISNVTPV